MDHLNVSDRFDGASHWASLPEEVQAAIGAAALERIAALALAERAYEDDVPIWDRVAGASGRACDAQLMALFVEAIPREALEAPDGAPRIPSLLGRVCTRCGCSEDDGCAEGCGWAREGLCTVCAAARSGGVERAA